MRDQVRLLTAAEVAERLGYTERYVWRLGREGVLPRIKVPGRKYVRFDEDDVERFIDGGRAAVRPAAPLPRRLPGFRVAADTPSPRPKPRPRY